MTDNIRSGKEPFMHVVKKAELTYTKTILLSLLGLVFAIVAGGIFILAIGHNPINIYASILQGAWRSKLAAAVRLK
jgi:simple sugar transport system permease protein